MDHHLADQFLFLGRERLARLLRPRSARGFGLARWDLDRLPRLKPVARRCALSVHAKLAGPRPARHDVERRRRQVALEPAVETDAVVVLADSEGTRFAHAAVLSRVCSNSRTSAAGSSGSVLLPADLPNGLYRRAPSPPRSTNPGLEVGRTAGRPAPPVRARRLQQPRRRSPPAPCTARASSGA